MGLLHTAWLAFTGFFQQEARHDLWDRVEAEERARIDKAKGNVKYIKYQGYCADLEKWKLSFEQLVSKMEERGTYRGVSYTFWEFVRLPKVPEEPHPFGYYDEQLACQDLYKETRDWQKKRTYDAMRHLGIEVTPLWLGHPKARIQDED